MCFFVDKYLNWRSKTKLTYLLKSRIEFVVKHRSEFVKIGIFRLRFFTQCFVERITKDLEAEQKVSGVRPILSVG